MERLTRIALAEPSVTILVMLILLGFGIAAAASLNEELIPEIDFPQATVVTVWPGATAEQVTQEVVEPIEKALESLKNIPVVEVSSSASEGFSATTVRAEYGTRQDDMRAAVEEALKDIDLPADAQAPKIVLFNFSDIPAAQIAVSGDMDQAKLQRLVQDEVVADLESVDGVSAVSVAGGNPERVLVTLDPQKMAQTGVTLDQIKGVLTANNITFPAGTLNTDGQSIPLQVGHRLHTLDDIRQLPLVPTGAAAALSAGAASAAAAQAASGAASAASQGAAPLTLGDIATVEQGTEDPTTISRLDEKPAISLFVAKDQSANTVSTVHGVLDKIDEIKTKDALSGVEFTTVFEQASFIEESLRGVVREGLLGALFAILVILVFLNFSVRATLVTAISIPLSVFTGFLLMWLLGQTLNLLTLSGMTVAIGRVVDDSIVVLENIYRHLQHGERRLYAIIDGTKEVSTAIFASTLVTVAVFLPLGFVGGITKQFFLPFGLTVTFALGASFFVAVTIVPVLARLFLSTATLPKPRESRLVGWYTRSLEWALAHRLITLVVAFIFFVASLGVLRFVPQTFLPSFGEPSMEVGLELPPGTALARTDEVARTVESLLLGNQDVASVQTTVGSAGGVESFFGLSSGGDSSQASFFVKLSDKFDGDLDRLTGRTREDLALQLEGEPVTVTVSAGGLAGPVSGTYDLQIQSDDQTALRDANDQVLAALNNPDNWTNYDKVPIINLASNLTAARDTVVVDVDPAKAIAHGLTAAQVGLAVRQVLESQDLADVTLDESGTEQILTVVARYPAGTVASVDGLRAFPVPGPMGAVPLGEIATVQESPGFVAITRVDGKRAALITGEILGQDTLGVLSDADRIIKDLDLPDGVTAGAGVESSIQRGAFSDTLYSVLFSIVIVYLIMAVIFGSLIHPLTILFSLPFAASGALIALAVTGRPLSISSMIGVLMLVGIVITNAIVLIDLVQQHRKRGLSAHDALVAGGRTRLRPILMTAVATVFALLPLALGLTEGAIIATELATVVIGGLVTSTLLTLIIVPVVYSLLDGIASRGQPAPLREGPLPPPPEPGAPSPSWPGVVPPPPPPTGATVTEPWSGVVPPPTADRPSPIEPGAVPPPGETTIC